MRLKKLVVVSKNRDRDDFKVLRDVFNVVISSTMPSFWEIIKDNSFYYVDVEYREKYKLKYKLITTLNKKLTQYEELKYFLSLAFNQENIVISPYLPFAKLLGYHLEGLPYNTQQFSIQIERYSVFKQIYTKLKKDFEKGILVPYPEYTGKVIMINFLEEDFYHLMRLRFPKARIIAHFVDCFDFIHEHRVFRDKSFPTVNLCVRALKNFIGEKNIFSYCRSDALSYNLGYEVNRVAVSKMAALIGSYVDYEVCFIGHSTYKRFNSIIKILEVLKKYSVSYIFVIPSFTLTDEEYKKLQSYNISVRQKIIFERVQYKEQLSICANSECIIDIMHYSEKEGLPYRIGEALALKKKIISNRTELCDYYRLKNVFLFSDEYIDHEGLLKFIKMKNKNNEEDASTSFDIINSLVFTK